MSTGLITISWEVLSTIKTTEASPYKMHSGKSGNAISTFLRFEKVVLIAKIIICTTQCKVMLEIIYSSLLLILYF